MRKGVWIGCLVVFGLCFLLFLFRGTQPADVVTSTSDGIITNLPSEGTTPVAGPKQESQPRTVGEMAMPFPQPQQPSLPGSGATYEEAVRDWRASIEFYGKVVDEKSNSVSGAQVRFIWTETPLDESQEWSTETDVQGLFSIQGKSGPTLQVEIYKEGYYTSRATPTSFHYALADDIFHPDASNPVTFILQKRREGDSLIHVGGTGLHSMRDFMLSLDGQATEVSLWDGHITQNGEGDLKVNFRVGAPLQEHSTRTAWECEVVVPGGGLVQANEEFPFFAPDQGYRQSDYITTATNWTREIERQYYVKLPTGIYGRVRLRILGSSKRPYFRLESFLNPSGSRSLEPR